MKIIFILLLCLAITQQTCVSRNGVVESGEQCDPQIPLPPCNSQCQLTCGNGELNRNAGEQCDPSQIDPNPPQGPCSNMCTYCGNGIWENNLNGGNIYSYVLGFEECDRTDLNSPGPCNMLCKLTCNNGMLQTIYGEQCDPSFDPSIPCDPETCKLLCGNGQLDGSEICDSTPGCMPDCTYCGNGATEFTYQQCDKTDPLNQIPCTDDCLSTCGNNALDAGQQCDGSLPSGLACDSVTCQLLCGNGQLDAGESCDSSSSNPAERGINCNPNTCQQLCNNGALDSGEQCDNFAPNNLFPCDINTCLLSCGNGKLDNDISMNPTQTCDPSLPAWNEQTCDPIYCVQILGCGDGIISPGQQCQAPFSGAQGGCDTNCHRVACRNGRIQGDQQCDDGNQVDTDYCNNNCQINNPCGNGILEPTEECDYVLTPNFCTLTCQVNLPGCGDGIQSSSEQCDDGNNQNNDGCNSFCLLEDGQGCTSAVGCNPCGNHLIDVSEGETCDDGNLVNGDGCNSACQIQIPKNCGDNFVNSGQQCDDGNSISGDGCSVACLIENGYVCQQIAHYSRCTKCGNGAKDPNEQCDDGNFLPNDGCFQCKLSPGWSCSLNFPTVCTQIIKRCGDGKWNPERGEECDDGDLISSNGCTRQCKITFGYECDNQYEQTSICYPFNNPGKCGDGNVNYDQNQQCDDNNLNNNDGCSNKCKFEPGFTCSQLLNHPTKCEPQKYCGNGIQEAFQREQCDDNNNFSGDGCSSDCLIQKGYFCFLKLNGTSACMPDPNPHPNPNPDPIPQQKCGDGKYDPKTEQCDDKNNKNGDGCSASCKVEKYFTCSDIPQAISECWQYYFPPVCGDGKLDSLTEQCDDGNKLSGDGCNSQCLQEDGYTCNSWGCMKLCGNGMIQSHEECDDFNIQKGDGCDQNCKVEPGFTCSVLSGWHTTCRQTCGNLMYQPDLNEQCDDGNRINGDGCSANCKIQSGYQCPYNVPMDRSYCSVIKTETCGNGIWEPQKGQECDDGNGNNNDGCSKFCKLQNPDKFYCTNHLHILTTCKAVNFCPNGYPLPLDPLSSSALIALASTPFSSARTIADLVKMMVKINGGYSSINQDSINILKIIFNVSNNREQWLNIQNIANLCAFNHHH